MYSGQPAYYGGGGGPPQGSYPVQTGYTPMQPPPGMYGAPYHLPPIQPPPQAGPLHGLSQATLEQLMSLLQNSAATRKQRIEQITFPMPNLRLKDPTNAANARAWQKPLVRSIGPPRIFSHVFEYVVIDGDKPTTVDFPSAVLNKKISDTDVSPRYIIDTITITSLSGEMPRRCGVSVNKVIGDKVERLALDTSTSVSVGTKVDMVAGEFDACVLFSGQQTNLRLPCILPRAKEAWTSSENMEDVVPVEGVEPPPKPKKDLNTPDWAQDAYLDVDVSNIPAFETAQGKTAGSSITFVPMMLEMRRELDGVDARRTNAIAYMIETNMGWFAENDIEYRSVEQQPYFMLSVPTDKLQRVTKTVKNYVRNLQRMVPTGPANYLQFVITPMPAKPSVAAPVPAPAPLFTMAKTTSGGAAAAAAPVASPSPPPTAGQQYTVSFSVEFTVSQFEVVWKDIPSVYMDYVVSANNTIVRKDSLQQDSMHVSSQQTGAWPA